MRHSLSPLIDIEVLQPSDLSSHSGDLGLFEGGALGPLGIGGFGESHDDSHAPDPFLLDVDWASVVPGKCLCTKPSDIETSLKVTS